MMSVSNKLDGNTIDSGHGQEGELHVCNWGCESKPTDDCKKYEDKLYEDMKNACLERCLLEIKEPRPKKDVYYWDEARAILRQFGLLPTKVKKHRGYELGAREFTLTYSPRWFDDATARATMEIAVTRLLKYYSNDILNLRAVGEVGSNGLSHIHCFYKLKGGVKITDKNFKRAYKYWNPKKPLGSKGFEGGHHASVKNEGDFLGYIDKDVETAWFDYTHTPDPEILS